MRRSLFALLFAAAACGGKAKSTTPPIPLPDDKPAVADTSKPTQPEEPKEPKEPPVPTGPIDLTLPASKVEVKLVNAGKGKKAALKIAPKAGAKQTTELTIDFIGGQDGPEETGGKRDEVAPTVVLVADAETQIVDASGRTTFQVTVSNVDARDKAGQKVSSAEFKTELVSLVGATMAGTVDANGVAGDLKVHVEKPDAKTEGAMQFLQLGLMPMWPVLPTEAIGPGAKWTVTSKHKVANQLDVTKVVSYELVAKKGTAWTIKGATKITGVEQTVQGAKLGNIGGEGAHEITLTEGALLPSFKQTMATNFTITIEPPPEVKPAPAPVVIKFHLDQSNALTPKG